MAKKTPIQQQFEYYTASGEKRFAILTKAELDPRLNKPVYVGISPNGHEVRLTVDEISGFSLVKGETVPGEWTIDCAHCGHEHEDWQNFIDTDDMEGEFDMKCENPECEKLFHVKYKTEITFDTSKQVTEQ